MLKKLLVRYEAHEVKEATLSDDAGGSVHLSKQDRTAISMLMALGDLKGGGLNPKGGIVVEVYEFRAPGGDKMKVTLELSEEEALKLAADLQGAGQRARLEALYRLAQGSPSMAAEATQRAKLYKRVSSEIFKRTL